MARTIVKWTILGWNLVMLVWLVSSCVSAGNNCAGETGRALEACQAGTGIGLVAVVFVQLVLWLLVDIILLVLFLILKPKVRA